MRSKASRLYPPLTHNSYLVLSRRRELLQEEIDDMVREGLQNLTVLDVGGHEKPYQPLFAPLAERHIALDLGHREADVHGLGEALPFVTNSVDVVLCTQVLEHVWWPLDIVREIYRVLKPGGRAFISVPAVFPQHGGPYDNWRFMSGGVRVLLDDFAQVRVMAEGGSIASFFRTLNMYLWVFTGRRWSRPLRWLLKRTAFPVNNLLGWYLDRWVQAGDAFAANWLAVGVK